VWQCNLCTRSECNPCPRSNRSFRITRERGQVIHFAEFQKFKRLTRSVSQYSLKTGILQYEPPDPFHTPYTVQCGVRRGLHRPRPRKTCGVRRGASMNRPPARPPARSPTRPRKTCGVLRGASMNRPPARSPTRPRKACGARRGAFGAVGWAAVTPGRPCGAVGRASVTPGRRCGAVGRAAVTPGKSAASLRKAAGRGRKAPALVGCRHFTECQARDLTCAAAENVSFSMNHEP